MLFRSIKQTYQLKEDDYILFLARIVPEKGLHYLMEAYSTIKTDKKLVIVGGSSHTDEYFEEIKQKASMDARIVLTGFVQGLLLEELYSNAYLYVLPSDIEGMPLSLLEAMSYQRCCLVSNIPENQEVIGEAGISFQHGNVVDLREKLEHLLKNKTQVNEVGEKAYQRIMSNYDWDEITIQTLKLYSGDRKSVV